MSYFKPVPYSRVEATQRVCSLDNWTKVVGREGFEWFYVLNKERSVLIRADRIFHDYSLMHADWHYVVHGMWSRHHGDLARSIGRAYCQWTAEMFESDTEEEEGQDCESMGQKWQSSFPEDVMDNVDDILRAAIDPCADDLYKE